MHFGIAELGWKGEGWAGCQIDFKLVVVFAAFFSEKIVHGIRV